MYITSIVSATPRHPYDKKVLYIPLICYIMSSRKLTVKDRLKERSKRQKSDSEFAATVFELSAPVTTREEATARLQRWASQVKSLIDAVYSNSTREVYCEDCIYLITEIESSDLRRLIRAPYDQHEDPISILNKAYKEMNETKVTEESHPKYEDFMKSVEEWHETIIEAYNALKDEEFSFQCHKCECDTQIKFLTTECKLMKVFSQSTYTFYKSKGKFVNA